MINNCVIVLIILLLILISMTILGSSSPWNSALGNSGVEKFIKLRGINDSYLSSTDMRELKPYIGKRPRRGDNSVYVESRAGVGDTTN